MSSNFVHGQVSHHSSARPRQKVVNTQDINHQSIQSCTGGERLWCSISMCCREIQRRLHVLWNHPKTYEKFYYGICEIMKWHSANYHLFGSNKRQCQACVKANTDILDIDFVIKLMSLMFKTYSFSIANEIALHRQKFRNEYFDYIICSKTKITSLRSYPIRKTYNRSTNALPPPLVTNTKNLLQLVKLGKNGS